MSDVFKQLMGNEGDNKPSDNASGYPIAEGMTPEIQKETNKLVNATLLHPDNRAFIKVHDGYDGGSRVFTKAGRKPARKWEGSSYSVKVPKDLNFWLESHAPGISKERAIISLLYYAQQKMQKDQDFIEYLD